MKKSSIYIFGFACIGITLVILLFTNSVSFKKVRSDCKLFEEFQSYIVNNNWEKAEEMLYHFDANQEYTPYEFENRPVIKNGKLMSMNQDATEYIIRAKSRFWHTYKSHSDKVILNNGYILFKNGKIIFIKFP